MEGLGELLRQTRESRGLSLKDVAQATKIREYYLKAIEEEQFDKLPGDVYAKGFIGSYADFLGLDRVQMMEQYKLSRGHNDEKVGSAAKGRSPSRLLNDGRSKQRFYRRVHRERLLMAIFSLIILIIGGVYAWKTLYPFTRGVSAPPSDQVSTGAPDMSEPSPSPAKSPVKPPVVEPGTPEQPPSKQEHQGGRATPSGQAPMGQAAPAGESTSIGKAAPEQRAEQSASQLAPGQPAKPESQQLSPSSATEKALPISVKIHARERCWIRVKADGRVIYEKALNPGEEVTWGANEEMVIRFGNAGGVDVEYNGKSIGSPGGRGDVIDLRFPMANGSD